MSFKPGPCCRTEWMDHNVFGRSTPSSSSAMLRWLDVRATPDRMGMAIVRLPPYVCLSPFADSQQAPRRGAVRGTSVKRAAAGCVSKAASGMMPGSYDAGAINQL